MIKFGTTWKGGAAKQCPCQRLLRVYYRLSRFISPRSARSLIEQRPHVRTPSSCPATPSALALAREVIADRGRRGRGAGRTHGPDFERAVGLLLACRGRVVVTGVGKSGHIGRKLAATLASTGTPAMFVHAAEAAHGDLGMITRDDVLLALSYSGEGDELLTMVPVAKRVGTPLIAMTGNAESSLARLAEVILMCMSTRKPAR